MKFCNVRRLSSKWSSLIARLTEVADYETLGSAHRLIFQIGIVEVKLWRLIWQYQVVSHPFGPCIWPKVNHSWPVLLFPVLLNLICLSSSRGVRFSKDFAAKLAILRKTINASRPSASASASSAIMPTPPVVWQMSSLRPDPHMARAVSVMTCLPTLMARRLSGINSAAV